MSGKLQQEKGDHKVLECDVEDPCQIEDWVEKLPNQIGLDESVLRDWLKLGLNDDDDDDDDDDEATFLNTDDPEIRKAVRRIKLEKRLLDAQAPPKREESYKTKTKAEVQMEDSMTRILELLEASRISVSEIRTGAMKNQLMMKKRVVEQREEIEKVILGEYDKAQLIFKKLTEKWNQISKNDDVKEIYEKTNEQKGECDKFLCNKDLIISNLKLQLKKVDRQFDEDLTKQNDLLNTLKETCNDQMSVLEDCYRLELQHLQNVVNVEKSIVLEQRKKSWEKAAGAKERLELENMVQRYDYLQQYEEQIDSMMVEQHETMKEQKMIMESNLNKLTVEESRYESAILISTELLNYNVQVLQKRQDENRIIKGHQKRIINQLQDTVRHLKQKQRDEIRRLQKEKKNLQDGIVRLHDNINTMNARLNNLAVSSNKKYFQLWDYNQGVAEGLIDKLLKADKKFHTSLLCVSWHTPYIEFSRKTLPSYIEAQALIKELKGKLCETRSSPVIQNPDLRKLFTLIVEAIENKTEYLIDDTLKVFIGDLGSTSKTLFTVNTLFDTLGIREKDDIEYISTFFLPYLVCKECGDGPDGNRIKEAKYVRAETIQASTVIVAKTLEKQFSVTNKVVKDEFCSRGAILNLVIGDDDVVVREHSKDGLPSHKKNMLGLGVEAPILSSKTPSKICDENHELFTKTEAGDEGRLELLSCQKPGHRSGIEASFVTRALNEFVNKVNDERKSYELKSLKDLLTQQPLSESRLMSEADVDHFWKGFGKIFSEKKKLMWKSLLTQMKVHYKLLLRRHNLNINIGKLRQKNSELRKLLKNYLLNEENHQKCSEIAQKVPFILDHESVDSLSASIEN